MKERTRILIVDDDVNFTESTVDLLNEKGFVCEGVNSGPEGIEKAKQKFFDFILMDIKMPVMNGVETFREVKKISPETVVIMITAFRVDDLIKDALREGAYGVVYKPIDINKITKLIERSEKGGALVMVADDDSNTCQTLKDNLEEYGYVVTTVLDGEEAVKMARERPQDIIFLDVRIPPLNGLVIYLDIKKINPDIKVVMMTAYKVEMKDVVDEALKYGALACLYKPFNMSDILSLLEDIVEKKRKKVKY